MFHQSIVLSSNQRGFTLLEVLVSVFILVLGLLGYAQLQSLGLQTNVDAYQQTQVALLARDLIDRIQANRQFETKKTGDIDGNGTTDDVLVAYNYDQEQGEAHECYGKAAVCGPKQMAQNDVYEWKQSLRSVLGTEAEGEITVKDGSNVFTIIITWKGGEYVVAFQPIGYNPVPKD